MTKRKHCTGYESVHPLQQGLLLLGLIASPVACGSDTGSSMGAAGSAATAGSAGSPAGGTASLAGASSTAGNATTAGTAGTGTAAAGGGAGGTSGIATGGSSGAAGSAGSGQAGAAGAAGNGGGGAGGSAATCPMPMLKPGDTDGMLTSGGNNRMYRLHVPATYNGSKPVPLIIDFHGLGGDGKGELGSSPYPAQTDADGVIMAFPTGLPGPSNNAWNVGPCCVKNTDDVAFAKALVAEISKTACVDPKRVYAVGFSMGGGMSHYLACHAADVFAAVAPAAFDLLKENVDDCKPQRPISVVSFRSTGDGVVNYAGGYSAVVQGMPINFLGAKATFDKWAQLNQCTGAASAEDANGCSTYAGCPGGIDVVLCTKQGGTHEPGNAKVAWPLLKKHTLP